MRTLTTFACAAAFALFSSAASAQFGFSIPGLGNIGAGKGGASNNSNILDKAIRLSENVSKARKEYTEAEEIQIGQQFAATLLGAKPLLANPAAQRYVNTLGRWLASQTERPDLPWTFGILDDADYNAFATPGGYIFVTRGLLERMRSEAELVGVLAHEIGHVLRKHHLNAVTSNAEFTVAIDAVREEVKGGSGQLYHFASGFAKKLYSSGLDKDDEFEADRIGVVIAARAGYDPFGLPAVLQVLQSESAQDSAFSLMFKTHPSPVDRVSRLDALMQSRFDGMPPNQGKPLKDRLKEFSK